MNYKAVTVTGENNCLFMSIIGLYLQSALLKKKKKREEVVSIIEWMQRNRLTALGKYVTATKKIV